MLKKLTLLFIGLMTATTAFAQPNVKAVKQAVQAGSKITEQISRERAVQTAQATRNAMRATTAAAEQLTNEQQLNSLVHQIDRLTDLQTQTEQAAREILATHPDMLPELLRLTEQKGINILPYLMKNEDDPSDILAKYLAYPSVVKSALDRGATVFKDDTYMAAVKNGYSETVALLREKLNIPYETKAKMFTLALEKKQFEVAKVLLADINLNSPYYQFPLGPRHNPLWENIKADNMEQVLFLLENGADPNFYVEDVARGDGTIAFVTLLWSDKWATYLPILKKYGATFEKIKEENNPNWPAYHMPFLHRVLDDLEKTKLLVELGANPRVPLPLKEHFGATPYEEASYFANFSKLPTTARERFRQVADYYKSIGADK